MKWKFFRVLIAIGSMKSFIYHCRWRLRVFHFVSLRISFLIFYISHSTFHSRVMCMNTWYRQWLNTHNIRDTIIYTGSLVELETVSRWVIFYLIPTCSAWNNNFSFLLFSYEFPFRENLYGKTHMKMLLLNKDGFWFIKFIRIFVMFPYAWV